VAETSLILVDVAIAVEKHIANGAHGRCLAIVDRNRLVRAGIVHQHETTAAEVTRARQRHGQGETDRYRGVDSVATVGEHLCADFSCVCVLRRHHAVGPENRVPQVTVANDWHIARLRKSESQRQKGGCEKGNQFTHRESFRPLM
jgi:hypothetical protein